MGSFMELRHQSGEHQLLVQWLVSGRHFAETIVGYAHQKVAGDGQVPGTLIFCGPQSIRQSSNFGSPASASVTHAESPADPLRCQST